MFFMPYTQLSDYFFDLPENLIAQKPCKPRDHSRLLVIHKNEQKFYETRFDDLPNLLDEDDHLVFNDTKVIPARLKGFKPSGAKCEIFCLRHIANANWEVMAKPGKKLQPGAEVILDSGVTCRILENLPDGLKLVEFSGCEDVFKFLEKKGEMPLPHYIRREEKDPEDSFDYQTLYAKSEGALAAPTAGLHFTDKTFSDLKLKGIHRHMLTLHVGLGTFRPVKEQDIKKHHMHKEFFEIPGELAQTLSSLDSNKRLIPVGTTSLRALESAFTSQTEISRLKGDSELFIYPGYEFKKVQHLLTNFHLPESTLMMLVCALGGYELIMEAYRFAVAEKFRFFSYGDAMLII
ncbi:MAG: tRNA preQ1(34) S-adenosylmethionine ribosyltransferase-isomerase QueA [Chlamydiales bacterium]|nr:tRNA preQ1(34) S-adenosylmethionine ribosyltransferase-isomerase QueA [Chlamydiales bacterium]